MKPITIFERHHDQAVEVVNAFFPYKTTSGVEIGTNAGDLTRSLLQCTEVGLLYTIDPWEHREGEEYEAGQPQSYHDHQEKVAREKVAPFGRRVEILKMKSDEAFAGPLDNMTFDFVWIDGHHEKSQVKKDIENAWRALRPDGLLGGHDYGLVPDCTQVIDEFMAENHLRFQKGGDYTWWTRKPL